MRPSLKMALKSSLIKGRLRLRSGQYIVCRQWPPDPLQLELTNRLDLYGILDLHQHSWADEDLTRLGFVRSREATLDTVPIAAYRSGPRSRWSRVPQKVFGRGL